MTGPSLGSDWSTPGTWNPSGPPGSSDTALFTDLGSAYTVNVKAGEIETVGTITLSLTGTSHLPTFAISGSLTAGTFTYDGNRTTSVTINTGGTLDVTSALTAVAGNPQTILISGKGTGGVGSGGHMNLGSLTVGAANVTYDFQNTAATGATNTGVIDFLSGFTTGATTTQTVKDVANGDQIIVTGASFTGDTVSLNTTSHVLTVTGTKGTVFTMDNVTLESGAANKFAAFGSIIEAVCYVRGTMIGAPEGEQPVERLRAGRQVITLVDGEPATQVVRWLAHRRISLAGHPRPETVAPVRIVRDAFADGMPHRDLVVSPDHAIFVDGKLICARQLVNGTTIRQELDWTAVDYYHVELDRHAILLAEGLPAESYIDTGNSGFFANSGAPLVLHPNLTDESDHPTREAGSCAPFVWDEASVRPVWQRLAQRAAIIGRPLPECETTADPALRLVAKGRTVKPVYADDRLVIFSLPRGAREIRLVSRAQSPTMTRPWLEDRRRLGVRVGRVVLRGVSQVQEVPVDHPGIAKGWWAVERDGQAMARWTDGDAVLPLPAIDGNGLLEIHLAGTMTYAVKTAEEGRVQRSAA
jgi:hypothetical protein